MRPALGLQAAASIHFSDWGGGGGGGKKLEKLQKFSARRIKIVYV